MRDGLKPPCSTVVTPHLGPNPVGQKGSKLVHRHWDFFVQQMLTLLAGSASKKKSARTRYSRTPGSGKK